MTAASDRLQVLRREYNEQDERGWGWGGYVAKIVTVLLWAHKIDTRLSDKIFLNQRFSGHEITSYC